MNFLPRLSLYVAFMVAALLSSSFAASQEQPEAVVTVEHKDIKMAPGEVALLLSQIKVKYTPSSEKKEEIGKLFTEPFDRSKCKTGTATPPISGSSPTPGDTELVLLLPDDMSLEKYLDQCIFRNMSHDTIVGAVRYTSSVFGISHNLTTNSKFFSIEQLEKTVKDLFVISAANKLALKSSDTTKSALEFSIEFDKSNKGLVLFSKENLDDIISKAHTAAFEKDKALTTYITEFMTAFSTHLTEDSASTQIALADACTKIENHVNSPSTSDLTRSPSAPAAFEMNFNVLTPIKSKIFIKIAIPASEEKVPDYLNTLVSIEEITGTTNLEVTNSLFLHLVDSKSVTNYEFVCKQKNAKEHKITVSKLDEMINARLNCGQYINYDSKSVVNAVNELKNPTVLEIVEDKVVFKNFPVLSTSKDDDKSNLAKYFAWELPVTKYNTEIVKAENAYEAVCLVFKGFALYGDYSSTLKEGAKNDETKNDANLNQQATNQVTNQTTNQATNQATKQSANQVTDQVTDQADDQVTDQTANQVTNQNTTVPKKSGMGKMAKILVAISGGIAALGAAAGGWLLWKKSKDKSQSNLP